MSRRFLLAAAVVSVLAVAVSCHADQAVSSADNYTLPGDAVWSDSKVTDNRRRLFRFTAPPTDGGSTASPDAIEELKDNKEVPQGIYAVVRDARDTFSRDALPQANQLVTNLPQLLSEALSQPLTAAVLAKQRELNMTAVATTTKQLVPSANHTAKLWGVDLPPSTEEVIRRLIERFIKGDLMSFLASALGVELAYRIGLIVVPITTAALRMLVADLRAAADHVLGAILSGVQREVWLAELQKLVVKNLRLDTLSMLGELRSTLSDHLGGLIISAIATAIQVGAAGRAIISQLFGNLINSAVKATVERETDRASTYLRKLWNMPEVQRLVNKFMSRARKLLADKN